MNLIAPLFTFLACSFAVSTIAFGAVKTEAITYKVGDTEFKGVLAYDDAAKEARPGVLVCPEWWGCNEYAVNRAKMLAEAGYVAFACDMYGDGKTTTDPKQAGEWAGKSGADPAKRREIAAAGLKVLTDRKEVDAKRCAAIGYCMGGTVALELARTGADLKAVVTFHASNVSAKDEADNKKIKAKILICDGAADTFVSKEEREKFPKQFNDAKLDWQFISYGSAVHSFTNKNADSFNIPGVKYDANADKRSWAAMKSLFDESFGKK